MSETPKQSADDFIGAWCLSKWGIEPELLKLSGRSPEITIGELAKMMDAYALHVIQRKEIPE